MTRGKRKLFWIAPAAILGIALFIFIGGEVVMRLWNWLLPALFGWRQITFWQGLGILALCRIFFGGFGGHRSGRSNFRRRMQERMAERYASMTPEEREGLNKAGGDAAVWSRPLVRARGNEALQIAVSRDPY